MTKRIIICGMSRSGTSLLYTLMANAIKGVRFNEKEVSALQYEFHDPVCLTKRPLDCFLLDQIFASFPRDDIRIIFSVRDPRDVICSVHRNVPFDYFCGFQNQYFVNPVEKTATLTNPGLWSIFQAWLKYKDHPNVITSRYEDLTTDPLGTAERLGKFIGEDMVSTGAFDIGEQTRIPNKMDQALNGVRAIDKKSVSVWRKHPQRVWTEFTNNKQMHDIVSALGYEEGPHWFFHHFAGRLPIDIN